MTSGDCENEKNVSIERKIKMRFLLVNPFCPLSEMPSPPLGLACLAAVLEKAGVEVKILDLVVSPFSHERMASLLEAYRPHTVGVTAVTMTFDNAMRVVRAVKQINPDILTLMGGPHVTFCAPETLRAHGEVDIIISGEGEHTIVEWVEAMRNDRPWEHVKGIYYRRGHDICFNGQRPFIADLDTLPKPARHLLPLGRYRTLGMPISMITSRGCPFKCIYCVGRNMVGAKVRYRSAQKVVDELEYLNRLNFTQINIADDLFTANKKHCTAVCDEIIKRGLELKWTSFARVDTISEDLLRKMKSAGCSGVSFGIESGNPEILRRIKKGITPEQVIEAVELCRRTDISAHGSFLLGLPGESAATLRETQVFGQRLKKMGLIYGFHLLAPFLGTEIREKRDHYGIRILTDDWSQYHANHAIVETVGATPQMLDDIAIKWETEFTEFLGDIRKRMETGDADEYEIWQVENLDRIVVVYDLMMKEAIEKRGTWHISRHPDRPAEALNMLVERVKDDIDWEPDKIGRALAHNLEQGHLRYQSRDGIIRWEWLQL